MFHGTAMPTSIANAVPGLRGGVNMVWRQSENALKRPYGEIARLSRSRTAMPRSGHKAFHHCFTQSILKHRSETCNSRQGQGGDANAETGKGPAQNKNSRRAPAGSNTGESAGEAARTG
jgi:hypothetical protein